MNPSMEIEYFGATDIGRVRTNNEDIFITMPIWDEFHILLVVIDGMGGEEGGEIASCIARDALIKYLAEFHDDTPLNLIKRAVADANNEIVRQKEIQPKYARMGCVATAGIIDVQTLTLSIAHVGDSRLYRYSNGELTKLTHDHSMVGYQEEQGILTEREAMNHPRRSIIERCLGEDLHLADDVSFIEGGVFPLIENDIFLFCSDGLSDILSSAEIAEVLKQNKTANIICQDLIDKANFAGGKDNITVVYAKVLPHDITAIVNGNEITSDKALGNDSEIIKKQTFKGNLIKYLAIAIGILFCVIISIKIAKTVTRNDADKIDDTITIVGPDSVTQGSKLPQIVTEEFLDSIREICRPI